LRIFDLFILDNHVRSNRAYNDLVIIAHAIQKMNILASVVLKQNELVPDKICSVNTFVSKFVVYSS